MKSRTKTILSTMDPGKFAGVMIFGMVCLVAALKGAKLLDLHIECTLATGPTLDVGTTIVFLAGVAGLIVGVIVGGYLIYLFDKRFAALVEQAILDAADNPPSPKKADVARHRMH